MPTEIKIKLGDKKLTDSDLEIHPDMFAGINLTGKMLEKYIKENKRLNSIEHKLVSDLANHGWYISGQINIVFYYKVLSLIESKKYASARTLLLKYYQENLHNLASLLFKKHPTRQQIFTEAFAAHKNKQYYASTILFLSQADGICEGKVFRGKKVFKKYIDSTKSPDLIKFVLGQESAIDIDTRNPDRANYFSDLNRHGVMHGLHLDFGKEENSLKALSLLCFISDFANRYK